MDSFFIFVIVTLWLVVMVPAIAAPLLLDRSKNSVNATQKPMAIANRTRKDEDVPAHRRAA